MKDKSPHNYIGTTAKPPKIVRPKLRAWLQRRKERTTAIVAAALPFTAFLAYGVHRFGWSFVALLVFTVAAVMFVCIAVYLKLTFQNSYIELMPDRIGVANWLGHRKDFTIGPALMVAVIRTGFSKMNTAAPEIRLRDAHTSDRVTLNPNLFDPADWQRVMDYLGQQVQMIDVVYPLEKNASKEVRTLFPWWMRHVVLTTFLTIGFITLIAVWLQQAILI